MSDEFMLDYSHKIKFNEQGIIRKENIFFIVGIGLSAFLLNHLSTTGNIKPYYPTTILTALFLNTAMISALMTILSSILWRHSILQEEILQKLKDKSKEQESYVQYFRNFIYIYTKNVF